MREVLHRISIIYRVKKDNKSQTEIARTIGFSQATISKELTRNSGNRI